MPAPLLATIVFISAYLLGSIPFGYLAARRRGVDIFKAGSGNIGATNIGRVLGKKLGVFIFILDFGKGALAVASAMVVRRAFAFEDLEEGRLEVGAGLAAFLGHLFPVFLGFRGGKGVATAAGVVTVLVPGATLGAALAWVTVAAVTNYISLASLAAAATLVDLRVLTSWPAPTDPRTLFCLLAGTIVFVKHRANIARLLHGTESRIRWGEPMRKTLHVLSLGLWFGSVIFFTFVVTLSLFATMEELGARNDRPAWFPVPTQFELKDNRMDGPKEQGSRVAGYAVGPLFHWYFLLQGICGVIAAWTALAWAKENPGARLHQWRARLLILALVTVLIGWPIERKVSNLRGPRESATDAFLQNPQSTDALEKMHAARSEFALWHVGSLFLNFATVILVTGGMTLAGFLPTRGREDVSEPRLLGSGQTALGV
jgi:glycerol-3-phosphate acyltransferase PlsY